jgi:hypothetical protein
MGLRDRHWKHLFRLRDPSDRELFFRGLISKLERERTPHSRKLNDSMELHQKI